MLIDNTAIMEELQQKVSSIHFYRQTPMLFEPFYKDFMYRFCWNSNHIEGNTLSLEETINVIDYDEVKSGHTFTEYQEAKNLFASIKTDLNPAEEILITEDWVCSVNQKIIQKEYGYRQNPVYIGTLAEAVYYTPAAEDIPDLMNTYIQSMSSLNRLSISEIMETAAEQHIIFERIHPFPDGNGRTGRIIFNQQLLNAGLLPIIIEDNSKYRQAFRRYHKNKDFSMLVHLFCKEELASLNRIQMIEKEFNKSMEGKANILKDIENTVTRY